VQQSSGNIKSPLSPLSIATMQLQQPKQTTLNYAKNRKMQCAKIAAIIKFARAAGSCKTAKNEMQRGFKQGSNAKFNCN